MTTTKDRQGYGKDDHLSRIVRHTDHTTVYWLMLEAKAYGMVNTDAW